MGLCFQLTQNLRDEVLLKSFIDFFGCGYFSVSSDGTGNFRCTKLEDIHSKIIPFFRSYPVIGVKSKDFEDFCLVCELINNKSHLTDEGLDTIREIKSGMNTGRSF